MAGHQGCKSIVTDNRDKGQSVYVCVQWCVDRSTHKLDAGSSH